MSYECILGDCLEVMKTLPENSIDSIITDPPYGLTEPRSGGSGTGQMWATRSHEMKEKRRGGFMGKEWDHAVPGVPFWEAALRVAKPGAMMLAFGGDRTHHRLMVAIEDAGWEIRTCIYWLTGQGFPKSLNVGKAIQKQFSADALCACDHHSTQTVQDSQDDYPEYSHSHDGQLRVDQDSGLDAFPLQADARERSRDGLHGDAQASAQANTFSDATNGHPSILGSSLPLEHLSTGFPYGDNVLSDTPLSMLPVSQMEKHNKVSRKYHKKRSEHDSVSSSLSSPQNVTHSHLSHCTTCGKPIASAWNSYGTALKPAAEIIVMAMKPLDGTYANNALVHGVAGLNVDGCRIGTNGEKIGTRSTGGFTAKNGIYHGDDRYEVRDRDYDATQGRWPSNLLLDESAAALLDEQSGPNMHSAGHARDAIRQADATGMFNLAGDGQRYGDTGGASRFFKVIKDDKYCSLCDLPCNANFAVKSSSQTDLDSDFATDHVRPLTQPNNAGKSELLPLFANNAESRLTPTPETNECSAPSNVKRTVIEQNVLNVKSAGSLCDSCATSIAAALVALQQAQSPESILGKAFMPEHTKQILTQCLASFVALLGSTDTILTMESLSLLFGSVRDAIRSSIPTNETANVPGQTSRLVYCSKASTSERNEGLQGMEERSRPVHIQQSAGRQMAGKNETLPTRNFHPTVKPIELMRYLCRLTKTPFGGTVLDPFMGSGSTGVAAVLEGRSFVGIEISEEYYSLAQKRLERAAAQPFLFEVT